MKDENTKLGNDVERYRSYPEEKIAEMTHSKDVHAEEAKKMQGALKEAQKWKEEYRKTEE